MNKSRRCAAEMIERYGKKEKSVCVFLCEESLVQA